MRQRAREIIKKSPIKSKPSLEERITNCDEIAKILLQENSAESIDLCPFPKKYARFGNIRLCCSCGYFFKNTAIPRCGCALIRDGELTINQAINGLRIFKNVMKRYLEEQERRPL